MKFSGIFKRGLICRMYIDWKVPIGVRNARLRELTYTISPSFTVHHELPSDWSLAYLLKGPFAAISHSFDFGRVDLHGNFRRGLGYLLKIPMNMISHTMSYLMRGFQFCFRLPELPIFPVQFLGLSVKLQSRRWFSFTVLGNYNREASDAISVSLTIQYMPTI